MRGAVFLYQGDELGLPDAHVPFERLKDPFAIASYAGGPGRDGARTPMPWTSAAPMGGFTVAADAWLPMDPAHLPLAIERQESRDDTMLNFTRRLIACRKGSQALKTGAALPLTAPDNVLAYERVEGNERVYCYFELGGQAAVVSCGEAGCGKPLLMEGGAKIRDGGVELAPYASAIVRVSG
jgi:alpha-glucosidase